MKILKKPQNILEIGRLKTIRSLRRRQLHTYLAGDVCQLIPNFSDGSFDLILQDVDKRLYPCLYQSLHRGGGNMQQHMVR